MTDILDLILDSSRADELEQQILKARDAYYNGQPIMEDAEFDALVDELKNLNADSPAVTAVGAPVPAVTAWPKVQHTIPMGSLDKVQTVEEMQAWVSKVSRPPKEVLLITEKLDGISISVEYAGGKLVRAVTRGDGEQGEDITPNVRRMKGILSELSEDVTLRGEIVLHKSDHKTFFPDKANPRNAASGTAKRLDGKGSEHLTVYFYQVYGPDFEREVDQYRWLKEQGFKTPHWYTTYTGGEHTPESLWQEYQNSVREGLDYEIDGLVVRLNAIDYQLSLGSLHGRPKGAVAFKFNSVAKETEALDLLLQVGGTGRITPVALLKPVELMGAEVQKASLYNWAYIKQIGFHKGASVMVTRANDVIPRILSVTKSVGEPDPDPTNCPECGYDLERDGEYIVCPNTAECPAQLEGRLKKWVSELGILEWGDVLIEKVVQAGLATDVTGLYCLSEADLARLDRMGPSSAKKARDQLWSVNPLPLERLVGALGIPLCATSTMELVVQAGYDTVDGLKGASFDDLQKIPGMGPKRAKALVGWLRRNSGLIETLLETGLSLKEKSVGPLTGKSFCFTGKMQQKRPVLERMAKDAGGQVKGSVGKGLTYLVIADPNSNSSKAVAARKNGTTCISEEAFLEMVGS